MRPKRDPVPRAKDAWVWLGGLFMLGMLGAGVTAAAVALWQNVDLRQLTPGLAEAPPPVPLPTFTAPGATPPAPFDVVLFESARNADYFPEEEYYPTQLGRWRQLLEEAGGRVRIARSAEDLAGVRRSELLVMPEAPCVSPAELAALGGHLQRGGNLVTNWALGVRDGQCAWRGWSTLLDVTGAEDIREIPQRQALYLTVPGGLPVSPGLDPGTRIELRPDPTIALKLGGERVYWSDWALNPAPDGEGVGADAAVVAAESTAGGRVTWFGFRTRQGATPADSTRLVRLIRNGILWAAGVPHAAPSPWPGAAQAAMVFAIDVEGRVAYGNALDVAAVFQLERLPISFYAVSQLVEGDAALGATLIVAGEVGSQTVDHTPLAGLTAQDQTLRLQRSFNDIERWTGVGPRGLRPPEDAIDGATLRAWKTVGGSYVLVTNEGRSASPEIHDTEVGPLVLVPRLLKDDYAVVVRDVGRGSQRLGDAYLAGARKVRALGGLAVVAGHTQIIVQGPRLQALRTVADTARAQGDWWLARAEEVSEWWLARSQVRLAWSPAEPPEAPQTALAFDFDLVVSTTSEAELTDLWIDVVAPRLPAGAIPTVDGDSVDFLEESWGMRVRLGTLSPDASRRISFVTTGASGATDGW